MGDFKARGAINRRRIIGQKHAWRGNRVNPSVAQAGANGQDGINGDDLKQFVKRTGEDAKIVIDVGRLNTRL